MRMLRDIYLYMLKIGGKSDTRRFPQLYLSYDEFSEYCMGRASKGLADLAEDLDVKIRVAWGEDYTGQVEIRSHASAKDIASDNRTSALSNKQKQKFQEFLPKKLKVKWVDEQRTEKFLEQVKIYKDIFK